MRLDLRRLGLLGRRYAAAPEGVPRILSVGAALFELGATVPTLERLHAAGLTDLTADVPPAKLERLLALSSVDMALAALTADVAPRVPYAGAWTPGGLWAADDLAYANGADVLSWAPREGSVTISMSAGATAAKMSSAGYVGGRKSVFFTGASLQRLLGNALAALANGNDTGWTAIFDVQPSANNGALLSFGNSGSNSPSHMVYINSSGNPASTRTGPDAVAATPAALAMPVILNARQMLSFVYSGTTMQIYNDLYTAGATAHNAADFGSNVNQAAFGVWLRTTASTGLSGYLRHMALTSQQFSAAQILGMRNFFHGTPRNILNIGDSITQGAGSTNSAGWRRPLWNRIATMNYKAELVGTWNAGTTWPHTAHEGNSGFAIDGIRSRFEANYGPGKTIPDVDLIVYMAGTNDMGMGTASYDAVGTPNKYAQALASMRATFANTPIAVTSIPPINPATYPTADANRIDFNSKLPAIWNAHDAANPTRPLLRWDGAAALGGSYSAGNFNADGVHPNDAGFALLYAALLAVIEPTIAAW